MRFTMPTGGTLVRTTNEFTHESTPNGLRNAHRVATGVWGRLRTLHGSVVFIFEDEPDQHTLVSAGEYIDIPPDTGHHVETSPGCRFVVEFYTPHSE